MAQNDEPLLTGLKALGGVNEFSRACSICGKTSQQGWGTGLRKDWKPASGIAPSTPRGNQNEIKSV